MLGVFPSTHCDEADATSPDEVMAEHATMGSLVADFFAPAATYQPGKQNKGITHNRLALNLLIRTMLEIASDEPLMPSELAFPS